ncbi:hypothetical protein [Cylindrospermum stagnale]|uniref:hypothetical protein n=1 Tax=Cylindrospermum stagnale TaxID=142864 RepID=UPI0002F2031E|nr:hypothetical protein [Cylindrospermum stagnale]
MTSFLCDQVIDFDAVDAYEAKDIEKLVNQIQTLLTTDKNSKVVVLLRNAHYLTTKAFAVLYSYLRQQPSGDVVLILVSADKSKIFPPLLDFVQTAA